MCRQFLYCTPDGRLPLVVNRTTPGIDKTTCLLDRLQPPLPHECEDRHTILLVQQQCSDRHCRDLYRGIYTNVRLQACPCYSVRVASLKYWREWPTQGHVFDSNPLALSGQLPPTNPSDAGTKRPGEETTSAM